jgi:hypothetical protein
MSDGTKLANLLAATAKKAEEIILRAAKLESQLDLMSEVLIFYLC